MENQIPLPTDNIYKFYALFGLLLSIFSVGSVIYVVHTTNDLGYQMSVDLAAIKDVSKPTDANLVKEKFLQSRLIILAKDRQFYIYALGTILGLGILLMFYGFWKWHRDVQPVQDEILKLQLEKLRHEVKSLKPHSHTEPPGKDGGFIFDEG
jgi:hypothetical protein